MITNTAASPTLPTRFESRVLREGYGPGAWHGADLKAALADVTAAIAYWRPASGRHNIAEIALHHAYCARAVRGQLSGRSPEPFVLEGEDWFDLADELSLPWRTVQSTVESEQDRLTRFVADVETGKVTAALTADERFNLVLGITCHAIYHAGQVQLIKRLRGK
jgi:DinB superfamily